MPSCGDRALSVPGKWTPALFLLLCTPVCSGAPSSSRISPITAQPGDQVTISGSGFGADISQIHAQFGPNRAPVIASNPKSLTVQVPNGQPLGSTLVTVDGSNALTFITTVGSKFPTEPNPPRCSCDTDDAPAIPTRPDPCANCGANLMGIPGNVNADRGEFFQLNSDLSLPGRPGADSMVQYKFRRYYRAQTTSVSSLGYNWDHNYFERLAPQVDGSPLSLRYRNCTVKTFSPKKINPPSAIHIGHPSQPTLLGLVWFRR